MNPRDKLLNKIKSQVDLDTLLICEQSEIVKRFGSLEAFWGLPCPVVEVDEFFEGIDDENSIAVNLIPHPGIGTFHRTLRGILTHDGVQNVFIEISRIEKEDHRPYSERIYILTSFDEKTLSDWTRVLRPDSLEKSERPVEEVNPFLPRLEKGCDVYELWWD